MTRLEAGLTMGQFVMYAIVIVAILWLMYAIGRRISDALDRAFWMRTVRRDHVERRR
jgi:hypothetical protein